MIPEYENKILKDAFDHYGLEHQTAKLIEELGEYMAAYARKKNGLHHNVDEEAVDVRIVLDQILKFSELELEDVVPQVIQVLKITTAAALTKPHNSTMLAIRDQKLDRLRDRVAREKAAKLEVVN